MKKILLILITLIVFSSCQSQDKKVALHPIVLKAKETSLYTKKVNWEEVNKEFIKLTKGKESIEDLKPGLQYLINSLGDKHGRFLSAKDYSIIVYYTGEVRDDAKPDNRDSEFVNNVINDVSATFSYQLLENDIGHLKIVAIGQGDVKEQADLIRSGLLALKEKGVKKWIVDLRFNGGGNMEPMISGLAPLIGEGFIGGGINSNDEIRPFEIKNGQFYNYNRLACDMSNLPKIDPSEKVAVLLSRYTISSGEMLAIAFKGREHTKFIGEPTTGYTTGTGYDTVNDDLALVIAQNVFIDRNKKRYDTNVDVDTFIEFQHQVNLKDDNQVNNAILWLNK